MASFKVVERATGREIEIKVGEFVFRNSFQTTNYGAVDWLDSQGFTEITTSGDSIIDKLGLDKLLQGNEYYFINNPDYYIKLVNVNGNGETSDTIAIDPTATAIDRITVKSTLYYLSVYKNNIVYFPFISFKIYKIYDSLNNLIPNSPYIYKRTLTECNYDTRIAFNFVQKQAGIISPYYWQFPLYLGERPAYLPTNIPWLVIPHYLNRYVVPNMPPQNRTLNMLYNYQSKKWETFDNYLKLSNIQCIEPIVSVFSLTSYNTNQITNNNNIVFYNNNKVDNKTENTYDFLYSLLFDTIPNEEPYPEDNVTNNPSGQSPTTIGGNPVGGDKSSTDILIPSIPSITPVSTGAVNLYEMTANKFKDFMSYLWTNPFYTAIIKLFTDPMQCIISAHMIGVNVPTSRQDSITIGNVTTEIIANVISNNFLSINFGSLSIPEFYGDSADYTSNIQIYLPYYGCVTLNPIEVINSTLTLQYIIDVLTGSFVAFIQVTKVIDGTPLNSVLYQYNGNMAYQIPLSSADYTSFTTTAISLAGTLIGTPFTKSVTQGLKFMGERAADIDLSIGYERSGAVSANVGYMSVKKAYVIIERPIHSLPPNFNKYVGYPYEGYVNLGSCSGLTICREVYINNVMGTDEETKEIRRLLMEGVIF